MGLKEFLKNKAIEAMNRHLQDIREDARSNISGYSSRPDDSSADETSPIGDAIFIVPARVNGFQVFGGVGVDLGEAPAAIAYEYGSGLQGDTGEEYPIPGEDGLSADAMIFEWFPRRPNPNLPWIEMYDEDGSGGIVGFNSGWTLRHPGVEEKRFMRDALDDNRSLFIRGIGKIGVASVHVFFKDKYGDTITVE